MVRKLRLKNFQSWKELEVSFTNVNVILGETNTGKSAILRALGAVFFNNLEGDSFVHSGATHAEITIETPSDTISLLKGPGVNRYILNEKVFDRIGRAVPDEIKEALGISELVFDDDTSLKLQIQSQLDAPFLLTDQGVRATRLLGTVSKVAAIYQAARLSSQRKRAQITVTGTLSDLAFQADQKVQSFDYLQSLEPLVHRLADLQRLYESQKNTKVRINQAYIAIRKAKEHIQDVINSMRQARHALDIQCQLVDVLTKRDSVKNAMHVIREFQQKEIVIQDRIRIATATVKRHQRLDQITREKTILDGFLAAFSKSRVVRAKCRQAISEMDSAALALKEAESTFVCPICGQEKQQ